MKYAQHVHIIGIGGIGTSAVAKWFLAQGATVTGSDVHESDIIKDLRARGVDIRLGHFAENVPRDCDLVVYTRAADAANVERQIASERGIKQWSYPEFLGKLAEGKKVIAVSGTNGKSTTTAMVAHLCVTAGLDPTVIVGTKVSGWKEGNIRIGTSDLLIVEACEYMGSMLEIAPTIAVITNIEEDHLDYYRDLEHIVATFQQWVDASETIVLNEHDVASKRLQVKNPIYFAAEDCEVQDGAQVFRVGNERYRIPVPGEVNCQNAAVAVVVGRMLEIDQETIVQSLDTFPGVWRRFEHVGVWKGADVFSDYAHHPTAVKAAIQAFKAQFPNRRCVVVFEPHQHARTHELFDDFTVAFDDADVLILSEIYEVAGRTEAHFETSKDLAKAIRARNTIDTVRYAESLDEAEDLVRTLIKEGDVLICMGAGTIDSLARKLAETYA